MHLRKSRKIILMRILSVGLLSLLILIPLSSATGVQNANLTLVGNILSNQLTDQSQDFLFSGDYILWDNAGGGLYLYSLKDNSTRTLVSASGGGVNGFALSDGTVEWSDDSSLHQYTISTGNDRIISYTNTTGAQKTYTENGFKGIQRWEPAMYGDQVVWFQGYARGTYRNADIAFLNATTNVVTLINESPTGKDGLVINGDNVIWCAYDENVTDAGTHNTLFLHNLVTGKDTVVSSATGLKRQDALSGDYIGWMDAGDPLATPRPIWRVYIYTISSGTARTVPASSVNQNLNFIAGDYAFYSECAQDVQTTRGYSQSCNANVFDIKTGNTRQILPFGIDRDIVGYSDGLLLIEDTSGDVPALSLFKAENLPLAETVTATPAPAVPENTVISPVNTTSAVPLPQASPVPGFGCTVSIVGIIAAIGISAFAGKKKR